LLFGAQKREEGASSQSSKSGPTMQQRGARVAASASASASASAWASAPRMVVAPLQQQQQHCKARRAAALALGYRAHRCRRFLLPPRALALPGDDAANDGTNGNSGNGGNGANDAEATRRQKQQQERRQQEAAAAWAKQQQQQRLQQQQEQQQGTAPLLPFLRPRRAATPPPSSSPTLAALRSLALLARDALTSPALLLTAGAGGLLLAASYLCDAAVVAAAVKASLKLMLLCGAVAALQARGSLPAETSRVLSQVAFNLTIPCMLATTTARTLAAARDPAQLVAVPAVAVFHVGLGAILGGWAAAAVEGRCPVCRTLFGWGPLLSAPAASREAKAAAEATARGLGVHPSAAQALLLPSSQAAGGGVAATAAGGSGDKNAASDSNPTADPTPPPSAAAALAGRPPNSEAIVRLACAFANVFTLPLLYLATLVPAGAELAAATAYVALYHAAWSPLLWTYGYSKLLLGGMAKQQQQQQQQTQAQQQRSRQQQQQQQRDEEDEAAAKRRREAEGELRRRRGGGGLVVPAEIVGEEQQQQADATAATAAAAAAATATTATPRRDADDGATPAEALVRGLWSASAGLRASAAKLITPPVAAVLVGLAVGATDLGKAIIGLGGVGGGGGRAAAAAAASAAASSSSSSSSSLLSWDAGLILGLLRCCWDVAETLATATLALQAIVLASSLFGGGSATAAGGSATVGALPAQPAAPPPAAPTLQPRASPDFLVDVAAGSTSSGSDDEDEEARRRGLPRTPIAQQQKQNGNGNNGAPSSSSPSLFSQLRPRGAWEWRVLLAVGAVRFLIVPAASVALLLWLRASTGLGAALLPQEKACMLALLLPSIAPPGQNLALVVQLSPSTAALTAPMSRLLLQLYALAVLPVTLWVAAVVSWL
jgi:predicted permease